jgi:uncharacterized membrane protein
MQTAGVGRELTLNKLAKSLSDGESTMNTAKKTTGFALAAAAAALLATAPMGAVQADGHEGKCMGVNGCKGQSDCATSAGACKGQNTCKGHGFLKMSKADCDAKGGTFEK